MNFVLFAKMDPSFQLKKQSIKEILEKGENTGKVREFCFHQGSFFDSNANIAI